MTDQERAHFIRTKEAEASGRWLRELWRDYVLIGALKDWLPASDPLAEQIRSVARDYYREDMEITEWASRLQALRGAARRRVN